MDSPNHTPTPQETQWRASALAPEKLRRQLKRINLLLCCTAAVTVAWLVLLCCAIVPFNWGILICLLAPLVTLLINRINIKRLQAGKQPY